jgi:hypothetical protein
MTETPPSLPVTIWLDGYRAKLTVTGFERRRNNGPVLTLAIAHWHWPSADRTYSPCRDIATLMRAADFLGAQGYHALPRNPDKCYSVPKYAKSRGDIGRIVTPLATEN